MAWRDDLRPASFRGVPFEVLDSSRPLGRKVVVHDYPLRDFATGEDLGQVPGAFELEGYVIGPDYMAARDRFEAALNQAGTGVLIVPWQGQRTVRLLDAKAHETTSEGGMVRYRLNFIEEVTAPPPSQVTDTGDVLEAAADDLQARADDKLVAEFDVDDVPGFVTDEAVKIIAGLSDTLDTLTAPLKAGGATLDAFVSAGLDLRTRVLTLVTKPYELAGMISGLVQGIRTIAATPADALGALKALGNFGTGFVNVKTTTPARKVQAANQEALVSYVRFSAVSEAVKAVAEIDFAAYSDAVDSRDTLSDLIDDIALVTADAGDTPSWQALSAVRVAMIADINARGGSLARLYIYTPIAVTNALVLAYRLYDGLDQVEARSLELVARNRVSHPGFVPAGLPLEVLSDV